MRRSTVLDGRDPEPELGCKARGNVVFVPLSTATCSHVNLEPVCGPEKGMEDDLGKVLGHATSASKPRQC